jgi:hypothetical protein
MFYRRALLEQWLLLEANPKAITFCERPGYVLINGERHLADFLVCYVGREEFVVLSELLWGSNVDGPHAEIGAGTPEVRFFASAELAAARTWTDNWQRILPYLVANRGLVPATLPPAIMQFLKEPRRLLDIEREFMTSDPVIVRTALFRLLHSGLVSTSQATTVAAHVLHSVGGDDMSRRKPELQTIDVNIWPTVAHTELDETGRRKFEARRHAILRYIAGEPIRAIEKSTHFIRRELYRWLERAQTVHPDGRPFGFRALIHYVRIAEYARVRDVQVRGERCSRGAAGALTQLLERYPTLTGWLLLQVKQRKVWLEQVHTDGLLRTRLRGLQSLHDNFLRQCRSVGLTAAD